MRGSDHSCFFNAVATLGCVRLGNPNLDFQNLNRTA